MMWEMVEVLSPYLSSASWLIDESKEVAKWTPIENKIFENALAVYDTDTPERWQKIAAMLPGKTVGDVIKQYMELEDDITSIEAGLVPIPCYYNTASASASAFSLDWVHHYGYDDGYIDSYSRGGKRGAVARRPTYPERKKGIPWTEEEHKLFLLGLQKYGKGDWRNISRNFVLTKSPTQVASHAQKYFIRQISKQQISGGKDNRRASIHDITTVDVVNEALSADNSSINQMSNSSEHSTITVQTPHQSTLHSITQSHFQWDQTNNFATIPFESVGSNLVVSPYGNGSYGLTMQGQNSQRSDLLENYLGAQTMSFEYLDDIMFRLS
ncbi:transcription factor DIVARICATA-like [Silene latifolia]|uniref:transcription factor DIVARICATA-like n=1 Tax=Silene latifolia TaxID=37657 RepID=UPI003D7756AF